MDSTGMIAIGAGMAVMTAMAAGLSMGIATGKACESVARQPEASGKISSTLLLGLALAESTAIYGFVIAIIMLFTFAK